MIKKNTLSSCLLCLSTLFCWAQKPDLQDKEVLLDLLLMESSPIDPEAKALEVYNKGTTAVNSLSYTSQFRKEAIYKVFSNEAAQELGTILIPYWGRIHLKNLRATVYNLEHGEIQSKSIAQSDLINERITEKMSVVKFFLPEVKKGSVITYEYTRISKEMDLLRTTWYFQGPYPSLHSEYEARIPDYFSFNPIVRVNSDVAKILSKDDLEQPEDSLMYKEGIIDVAVTGNAWVRRNVPAFKPEAYMSSPENYMERVKLHLKSVKDGSTTININLNWDEICQKRYLNNKHFAKPAFGSNRFLRGTIEPLTASEETPKGRALAIYNFVRDSLTLYSGADVNEGIKLKDVLKKRSGSNYELNLLLVAMLRNADLEAYPVLLSTIDNERLTHEYPEPDNLNYMITLVKADKDSLYLDPSNKYLAFGILPPYCLNGYSRIISEPGGFTQLLPEQFKDNSIIMVNLNQDEHNGLRHAKVSAKYGWISSFNYRTLWGGDTVELRRWVESQINDDYRLVSVNSNIDQKNDRLTINYKLEKPITNDQLIYFSPYVEKIISDNPFPAITRKYPVEFPYLRDIQYILSFQLPGGLTVEEGTETEKKIMLKEKGVLSYVTKVMYQEQENLMKVYSRYTENSHFFPATDYEFLRKFYEQVIEHQNRKLVLKKNNHH